MVQCKNIRFDIQSNLRATTKRKSSHLMHKKPNWSFSLVCLLWPIAAAIGGRSRSLPLSVKILQIGGLGFIFLWVVAVAIDAHSRPLTLSLRIFQKYRFCFVSFAFAPFFLGCSLDPRFHNKNKPKHKT